MQRTKFKEADLQDFQKSRVKLNNMISDLFGPDAQLHEISEDSEPSSIQSPAFNLPVSTNKSAIGNSAIGNNPDPQLLKKKVHCWERIKSIVIRSSLMDNASKMPKTQAIQDSNVAAYLAKLIEEVIENRRLQGSIDSKNIHEHCEILLSTLRVDLRQIQQKNNILQQQLKKTKEENLWFKQKIGLGQKQASQNSQVSKYQLEGQPKKATKQLIDKILHLEAELRQSRKISPPGASQIQIQKLKRLIAVKDQNIENLTEELRSLKVENVNIQVMNKKLRKIVRLAKHINDQFIQKQLQSPIPNSDYFPRSKEPARPFHLTNQRVGIVKSRSLAKSLRKASQIY